MLPAPSALGLAIFAAAGGAVGQPGSRWDLAFKFIWPVTAINGYSTPLSAASLGVLGLIVLRLRRANALNFEPAGGVLAAAFILLYLATPQWLQGTAYVDVRVLVAAALVLPAFVSVRFPNSIWRRNVLAILACLVAVNLAYVAVVWTSYRADYREIIASFAQIGKGAKILVAREGDETPFRDQDWPPMSHAPVLAVHYAKALVSATMAVRGKQPLMSRPEFQRLNAQDAHAITVATLKEIAEKGERARIEDEAFRHWPEDFDYIYLIGAPIENPLPKLLEALESRRRFTLYRIRKGPL